MTLWLIDRRNGTTGIFVDIEGIGYQAYVATFLPTAGNFILQTGVVPVVFAKGSVWAAIWSLVGGFTGVLVVTLMFAIISHSITQHIWMKKEKKARDLYKY